MTRDQLLADLSRALRQCFPDRAEEMIRECEKMTAPVRGMVIVDVEIRREMRPFDSGAGSHRINYQMNAEIEFRARVPWSDEAMEQVRALTLPRIGIPAPARGER